MGGWARVAVIAAAGGASVGLIASTFLAGRRIARWAGWWRSKSAEEIERLRRQEINGRGRIASAEIVDVIEKASGSAVERVVVYRYEVAGVTYEAAQEVSAFTQREVLMEALAGSASSVKYDPRKPINSIIACEGWSGISGKTSSAGTMPLPR